MNVSVYGYRLAGTRTVESETLEESTVVKCLATGVTFSFFVHAEKNSKQIIRGMIKSSFIV